MTTRQSLHVHEVDARIQSFVRWALAALKVTFESVAADDALIRVTIAETDLATVIGQPFVELSFVESPAANFADSAVGGWLIEQLQANDGVWHIFAGDQPTRVYQLTERLFERYTVDGGSMRLAGCSLEDKPLLRFSYLQPASDSTANRLIHHVLVDTDGQPVDGKAATMLADELLEAPCESPPSVSSGQAAWWRKMAEDDESRHAGGNGSKRNGELICVCAVWCKFATGKLHFKIGDSRAELLFADWAKLLADGTVAPPPYECPSTKRKSYHLAATDEGDITVREAIAECELSGSRVLETDLKSSPISGRRAVSRFFVVCPVSGENVLTDELSRCEVCDEMVSPAALEDGLCAVCRSLKPVSRDDPRMARILGEFPKLDGWRGWRIGESETVYVLTATSLLQKVLIVIEHNSLNVLRFAKASRFSRKWTDVSELERREYIG